MTDRVTTMVGDYIKDPIGGNYDLIWASATLNFVSSDLKAMLEREGVRLDILLFYQTKKL